MESSARSAAVRVVRILRDAGFTAYFAGGCVRDGLRGKAPKDYDIATDAKPQQVRDLFKHSRYVGEAFGVVLVSMLGQRDPAQDNSETDTHESPPIATAIASTPDHDKTNRTTRDGRWIHTIEVATFRTEWGYADGRRPSAVEFSDAENDARRRDFTINGLFEDPLAESPEHRIIDHVGGQRDLAARILRAIGDPQERFGEDYLRLLRAVRFAARLDFALDPLTAQAIKVHASQLSRISRERIGQEVELMLTGPRPARCIRLMHRLGLAGPVLNESSQKIKLPTVTAAGRIKHHQRVDYPTLLAAWMMDRHLMPMMQSPALSAAALEEQMKEKLPPLLANWREALCLPNHHRDALKLILQGLPIALDWPDLRVAKRKRLLARDTWQGTWTLLRSLRSSELATATCNFISRESPALIAEGVNPVPLITGNDLIAAGIRPGKKLGQLLDSIYDAQLEGAVTTHQSAIDFGLAEHSGTG